MHIIGIAAAMKLATNENQFGLKSVLDVATRYTTIAILSTALLLRRLL